MANTLTISGEFALAVFEIRTIDRIFVARRCFRQNDLAQDFAEFIKIQAPLWSDLIPYFTALDCLVLCEYATSHAAERAKANLIHRLNELPNIAADAGDDTITSPFGVFNHGSILTLTATPEWVAAQAFRPLMPSPPETPDIETADTVEDATTIGTGTTQNPGAVLSVEDGGIA